MIKIITFFHSTCIVASLAITLPASATSVLATNTDRAPNLAMNQQSEKSNQGDKDKAGATDTKLPEEAERKKQCAKARKNLDILKGSQGTKTFRTSEGEIVRYTPDQIKQMIQDNESVVKDNCE